MVDLGSGDGRLVIAAAEAGFTGTGVELNPWLNVWAAVQSMKASGTHHDSSERGREGMCSLRASDGRCEGCG